MNIEPSAAPLALEGFRVRMYRSIRDSGFVPVFPLTALVGRREAGKTALLRALSGLGGDSTAPYSLEHDWPRGMRPRRDVGQVVCAASFRFGADAHERLARAGTIEDWTRGVILGRTYGGELLVEPWDGEPGRDWVTNGKRPPAARPELAAFAREHLPLILYAEQDSVLPGALPTADLASASRADDESGTAALARLLSAAGLGSEELRDAPDPRRVREAGERVRELLSGRGQSQGLAQGLELDLDRGLVRVYLRIGGGRAPVDQLPRAERYRLTLDLRLAEARDVRSGPAVLLLDGPGRAFRGKARHRMHTLFEQYNRNGVTVLYTARLPFEIQLQHAEQVLVLGRAREGPVVSAPALDADAELAVRAALGMTGRASFLVDDVNVIVEGPSDAGLLMALDDLMRRSGEPALPSDVNVTSAGGSYEVAAVAAFLGRQGLCAIGLLDSDAAGDVAHSELLRKISGDARASRVEIMQLAPAAGLDVANATIEDLFPRDLYIAVAHETCGPEAQALIERTTADSPSGSAGDVALRLTRAFEAVGERFPKAQVAKALEAHIAALGATEQLPRATLRSARTLMTTLRDAAARHSDAGADAGSAPGNELSPRGSS